MHPASAYQAAFRRGWDDAWRDHFASFHPPPERDAPVEAACTEAETRAAAAAAAEAESPLQLVLNPEWAAFFARRRAEAAHRAAEEERLERERLQAEEELVDLGGGADRKRVERAALYGVRRDEVLQAEAQINAHFQTQTRTRRAPHWPALPLRDWSPDHGGRDAR